VPEVVILYPVLGKCPHCSSEMVVTRLHCRNCDSSMEGQFTLGKFYHLTPEQLSFVETFVRCEGKITRVEEELGISYPTVRGRLTDVIRALGYEVRVDQQASQRERREVLDRLSRGDVSLDEALDLLRG
jgi:hypothetical protein